MRFVMNFCVRLLCKAVKVIGKPWAKMSVP